MPFCVPRLLYRRIDMNAIQTISPRRRHSARGMALVMVIAVLATASILAYAILSSASLQGSISDNLSTSASSEYIAESGINIATYYLQNPELAPASWTSNPSYKLQASGVPLNDGTSAAFDVTASATATRDLYNVSSIGYTSASSPLTRTATAQVKINRAKIPAAGVFGGAIAIPLCATFSDGGISGAAAIQANGVISLSGVLNGLQLAAPLTTSSYIAPTASNVNYYGVGMTGGVYLFSDGTTTGTPQSLVAPTLTAGNMPSQAANNPAGIYYYDGNLTINSSLTINGTLIIRGGNLTLAGNRTTLTINPKSQFPALICEKRLTCSGKNAAYTFNGVVFLGTGLTWGGSVGTSKIQINGALVMPSGKTIVNSISGTLIATYTPSNIDVPTLTQFDQPGISVQTTSWSQ